MKVALPETAPREASEAANGLLEVLKGGETDQHCRMEMLLR